MYGRFKRGIDVGLIILSSILWLPLLLVAMALVRVFLGAPVFFVQTRLGKDGKPFRLIKLRTMLSLTDEKGVNLPDRDRLTPFGKWLRSTSLDELPELINILRGEMSLVGPRPLLVKYSEIYSERQRRRLEVLPGLTGWSQIKGRNAVSWENRLENDVWYVENQSLLLDLQIILATVWCVIRRDGITADGEATMGEFKGNVSRRLK